MRAVKVRRWGERIKEGSQRECKDVGARPLKGRWEKNGEQVMDKGRERGWEGRKIVRERREVMGGAFGDNWMPWRSKWVWEQRRGSEWVEGSEGGGKHGAWRERKKKIGWERRLQRLERMERERERRVGKGEREIEK
jgi:hypothetical protein